MKKTFLGITITLALLACALPTKGSAESVDYVLYNSTTAAADAAIAVVSAAGTPLNTSNADSLTLHFRNAGSGARTAAVECWDPGLTQTISRHTVSVPATSDAHVYIDPHASSATAAAGYTVWPMKPCHRMKITAAAATGTMRTIVLKRTSR
jgi:hypothetical protein